MSKKIPSAAGLPPWQRRLAAAAGVTTGIGVLAAVTLLYADAARMTWLPPTPENLASMQRCENVHGTAARQACAQTVIAQVRGRDSERRMAERAPEPVVPSRPN